MAITPLQGERVIGGLTETVEGQKYELMLTDRAVYYECEKPTSTIWISAALLSLAQFLGILSFFAFLRTAHVYARIRLDQIDHLEVRRIPRILIMVLGIVACILVVVFAAMSAEKHRHGPGWAVFVLPVLAAVFTNILLVLMPRAQVTIGSHSAKYSYQSKATPGELQPFLKAIDEARERLQAGR
ncbi:MAG TPA: hypothetical protein VMY39_03265 [Planctomycetota bacterium]|nr:hypothetical protein [Planctomycetota bacterium]